MKPWTEEDLILLYYQELDPALTREIEQAMAESSKQSVQLRRDYDALCKMLGDALESDVPEPSADLNQQIMLAIREAEAKKQQTATVRSESNQQHRPAIAESLGERMSRWLAGSLDSKLRPALMFLLFAVIGIFYLGRWSAMPLEAPIVDLGAPSKIEQSFRPSDDASRRVLLTNVSSHIETSQRLLTLVSNGGDGLSGELEPRRQMIDELISFNRLYRRVAVRSGDTMLANVLQQMESVLLEISHTKSSDDAQWNKVRERLDGTDLLFKLKVTDKRINHELI